MPTSVQLDSPEPPDLQKDLLMYPEKELDTIEEEDGTSSNELGLSMTQLGIAQK